MYKSDSVLGSFLDTIWRGKTTSAAECAPALAIIQDALVQKHYDFFRFERSLRAVGFAQSGLISVLCDVCSQFKGSAYQKEYNQGLLHAFRAYWFGVPCTNSVELDRISLLHSG